MRLYHASFGQEGCRMVNTLFCPCSTSVLCRHVILLFPRRMLPMSADPLLPVQHVQTERQGLRPDSPMLAVHADGMLPPPLQPCELLKGTQYELCKLTTELSLHRQGGQKWPVPIRK